MLTYVGKVTKIEAPEEVETKRGRTMRTNVFLLDSENPVATYKFTIWRAVTNLKTGSELTIGVDDLRRYNGQNELRGRILFVDGKAWGH